MKQNDMTNQKNQGTGSRIAVSRDVLLGYLLHSLDEAESRRIEREIQREPFLLGELAAVQQELAPLRSIAATVTPPAHLASRTCTKIWDTLDKKNGKKIPADICAAEPQVLSKAAALQTALQAAPQTVLPLRLYADKRPSRRSVSRWFGFIASVALGMFIAFMMFPLIKFVKYSTVHYVKESQLNAINERLAPFEQINAPQKTAADVQNAPFNLRQFNWKELTPDTLLTQETVSSNPLIIPASVQTPPAGQNTSAVTILGQTPYTSLWNNSEIPFSFKQRNVSDDILLSTPQGIQTGSGQTILFKDSRIFFRDLPQP
ncbi:MAG: hypothetical protein LBT46_13945 [Planctomycetaceae bacterium]|nr:hypothetical protein [Planctomycetaceae bacterium]